MKSQLLMSTGALFVTMMACSSTTTPPITTTGTGGNSSGSGGSSSGGSSAGTGGSSSGSGGTTSGSGGSDTGTGGSTGSGGGNGSGGTSSGTGGAATGTGGTPGTGGGMGGTGAGTGGANTGTGGGGTGTGGGGGGGAALTITSTQFGNFDNAFMITPCQGAGSGFDCPNLPMGSTSCPTAAWSNGGVATTEATGSTYTEVFNVSGGDPTKVYNVTVKVLGQAEGRTYTGGTRALTANVDPNAATNNLLYTGGKPGTTRVDYNVFSLTITPGTSTAIAGADTYYAFNAVDTTHEGNHYNYGLDETFTMKVKSGFILTLTSHDSNCVAIKNCGPGGPYGFSSASACEANARSTPASITLPATFRGQNLTNPTKFQTQFVNFKVTATVAQ